MVEQVAIQLHASADGVEFCALRPPSIFRTAAEVAEADQLQSELKPMLEVEDDDKVKWEVIRAVKNGSNNVEIEVGFGFDVTWQAHILKLRLNGIPSLGEAVDKSVKLVGWRELHQ